MKKIALSTIIALSFCVILTVGSAQADSSNVNSALPSAATAGVPGGVVDPCLNNPNIYVQQSCEQARQAAINNNAMEGSKTNPQAVTTPEMPAWQQALQHDTANTNPEETNESSDSTGSQSP